MLEEAITALTSAIAQAQEALRLLHLARSQQARDDTSVAETTEEAILTPSTTRPATPSQTVGRSTPPFRALRQPTTPVKFKGRGHPRFNNIDTGLCAHYCHSVSNSTVSTCSWCLQRPASPITIPGAPFE
jgi:hypothetical protein